MNENDAFLFHKKKKKDEGQLNKSTLDRLKWVIFITTSKINSSKKKKKKEEKKRRKERKEILLVTLI